MAADAPASSVIDAVEEVDEEEEEEDELVGLDYARHHGLSTPYYVESLLVGGLPTPPRDDFDQNPWGSSHASITDAADALTKERLTVNKDAALLLKAVHDFREPQQCDLSPVNPRQFPRHAKQELPVLRTDNELDMLNFGHATSPDLTKLNIPSEAINEGNDEGFEWPRKYFKYPTLCEAQIKAEKLAVSRDGLLHLQEAIRDSHDPGDYERLKVECLCYQRNTARQPVTPPMLPLSPKVQPYVPSSPANRLPLLSDSSDSVTAEATALELRIMGADTLTRKNSDSSDSMLLDVTHPPPLSPLLERRTTPFLKRPAEDLKVEGPLTPQTFSDSPMKKLKSVTFSKTVQHFHFPPDAPWRANTSEDGSQDNESFFDEAFQGLEPATQECINRIENEKLSAADTTGRVDVPHVNFTLPVAPWNEYSQRKGGRQRASDPELGAQMKFLRRVQLEDLKTATSWHGISSLDRQLSWNIFTTRVAKTDPSEQLHGGSEVEKVLTGLTTGNIATGATQIWKQEGLRILDEDDNEDVIEPEEAEERRDMEALIRKRKLEIEEEAMAMPRKRASPQPLLQMHSQPRKEILGRQHRDNGVPDPRVAAADAKVHTIRDKPAQVKTPVNDHMFGGFSATSALHKFMETRGKAVEDVKAESAKVSQASTRHKKPETVLDVRSRESSSDHSTAHRGYGDGPDRRQTNRDTSSSVLPQLSPLPGNLAPCSLIVSSHFLKQRGLMKQVESMYQAAEIVYRDYDLPHSPFKEADMLLSPSTGLMLTTLQQIKQRPLPGQVDHSPVKARIKHLQSRCERLVVIVSEGLSREMEQLGSSRPDDPRDTEALSHFEDFGDRLEGEVVVKYVRGGEQGLAHAVVVEMAKYGLQHGSKDIGTMKPLAAETIWEVFLRRAGLNPFAAQIIVASLQEPLEMRSSNVSSLRGSTGDSQGIKVSGLSAFIVMSEQERIKRFQALMGGSRILKAVGKAVDQVWMSAAHGFQM